MNSTPPRVLARSRAQPRRLELDVAEVGGRLRFSVSQRGSEGSRPLRTCEESSWDEARVEALRDEMTALLNRASRWGDLEVGSRQLLRAHGELLFDELLPEGVKKALRSIGPCELTLVLDAILVRVPWEWMHTGDHFLGLDYAVGRLVRSDRQVVGEPRPPSADLVKLLVVCDPRGDLMGSYYEGLSLRDRLDAERDRATVDLRSTEVQASDIRRLLREYDVIHYAGHAEIHHDRPEDSGWLTHDGVLTAESVLALAGGRPFPRLVFANACRSGQVDAQLMPTDQGEAVYGLASAFLLAGVQHYVGTLWDVPDEPACHFSMSFYDALLAGRTFGRAMLLARQALQERYGTDGILWAGYVLYGDPGVTLLRAVAPAHRATAARRSAPPRSVLPIAAAASGRSRTPGAGPRVTRGPVSGWRRHPTAEVCYAPSSLGSAIFHLLNAHELTGDKRFLARAEVFAKTAYGYFLGDDRSLPKATVSQPHYEANTGADSLMMAYLELWHRKNATGKDLGLVWSSR